MILGAHVMEGPGVGRGAMGKVFTNVLKVEVRWCAEKNFTQV